MILQELLRNFILYREVIKPLFETWTESQKLHFFAFKANLSFYRASNQLQDAKVSRVFLSLSKQHALSHITGSRTITSFILQTMSNFDLIVSQRNEAKIALIGSHIHIALATDQVYEYAVNAGKLSKSYLVSASVFIPKNDLYKAVSTTGFESKQIKSNLISETHEKREYLGEFSLTHEETPLLYQKRGGEYHDIY